MLKKRKLFGIDVVVSDLHQAAKTVVSSVNELRGEYISFANVHTTVMATEDRDYHEVQKGAIYVMPDGRPLSRVLRWRGYSEADQIAGPDFMKEVWELTKDGSASHYFYGSSEVTIKALENKLREEYPGLKIAGMESPPFRDLSSKEDEEAIERINCSGADYVWIGLGAPKQERYMWNHKGKINGVMLGVGAGFDFHAGTMNRAPKWMQNCCLEWLYRLCSDPKRLWKRYVVTNTKFILLLLSYGIRRRQYEKNR